MFTLGYSFRPWTDPKAIADGAADPATTSGTPPASTASSSSIRFHHRVVGAEWSSDDARWTVHAQPRRHRRDGRADLLVPVRLLRLLPLRRGLHAATSPGVERFTGPVVHPQHWPEDLDYAGKRVVVIGSGATAVTLVPALAETAGHVTMLQRSPTYIVVAARPRPRSPTRCAAGCPPTGRLPVVRWKNVAARDGDLPAQPARPAAASKA